MIYLIKKSPSNEDFILSYGYAESEDEIKAIITSFEEDIFLEKPEEINVYLGENLVSVKDFAGSISYYHIVKMLPRKTVQMFSKRKEK